MKTLETVKAENPGFESLIKGIYDQAGENLPDIIKFGIEPGFNEFTYHKDTVNSTKTTGSKSMN